MHLGGLLERFGVCVGSKMGGGSKLGLSWHQNRKNSGPKMMSKNHVKKRHTSSTTETAIIQKTTT